LAGSIGLVSVLAYDLSREQVKAAVRLHGSLDGWRNTDAALDKLRDAVPGFDDPACLLKSVAINSLYGTQIISIVRMANHVRDVLNNSAGIDVGNERDLVQRIASIRPLPGDKPRVFTSFSAKFCHFFIDSERFPIYDEAARTMLRLHLGTTYKPTKDAPYEAFCIAFEKLRVQVGASARDLDRYLWLAGMYDRWLRQRLRKQGPLVNAELLRLFTAPTKEVVQELDLMLPRSHNGARSPSLARTSRAGTSVRGHVRCI
jgi:hypothetical protein